MFFFLFFKYTAKITPKIETSIKNIIETKEYLIWQQAEFKTNHMDAAHKIFTSVLENN